MNDWKKCNCETCHGSDYGFVLHNHGYNIPALGCVAAANDVHPPPWFNEQQFKRGQKFFQINFMSVFVSNLVGLVSILNVSGILSVLTGTAQSNSVEKARRRYLSTLRHVYIWYTGDVFQAGTRSANSIKLIRQMHMASICIDKDNDPCKAACDSNRRMCGNNMIVGKKTELSNELTTNILNKCPPCMAESNLANVSSPAPAAEQLALNPKTASFSKEVLNHNQLTTIKQGLLLKQKASQVDMVATQWAFCGIVALCWEELGIAKSSLHLMDDFLHFWRTIGYLMGIEDRFNLCEPHPCLEENQNQLSTTHNFKVLLHQLLAPAVMHSSGVSKDMIFYLLQGAYMIVPFVDPSVFTCFTYRLLGATEGAARIHRTLKWNQRLLLQFQVYMLGTVLHMPLLGPALRRLLNFLMYVAITYTDNPLLYRVVVIIICACRVTGWMVDGAVAGCRGVVVGCRGVVAGCRGVVAGCRGVVAGCRGVVTGCKRVLTGCKGVCRVRIVAPVCAMTEKARGCSVKVLESLQELAQSVMKVRVKKNVYVDKTK